MTITEALTTGEQLREELQAAIEQGDGIRIPVTPQKAAHETLAAYAKRWLLRVERTGRKRPHVIARDVTKLEAHILPYLGHLALDQIGKADGDVDGAALAARSQTARATRGRP